MLVAITDFGSVWRHRFNKDASDPLRFARGVYYNTTGVEIAGTIRQRPRIPGYARFHNCGGFDAHHPQQMINRVFECADPCVWNGDNKLLFHRILPRPERPDRFLVVLRPVLTAKLHIGNRGWRCQESWLLSFSECGDRQEAMLLLPAYGWIESELGRFVLQPAQAHPWIARLALTTTRQEASSCAT
ncbi:MAG: hypothetical protein ACM3JB_18800 [Acidobacteriaceae bacterium]